MLSNPQFPVDLVTFSEEVLNGKLLKTFVQWYSDISGPYFPIYSNWIQRLYSVQIWENKNQKNRSIRTILFLRSVEQILIHKIMFMKKNKKVEKSNKKWWWNLQKSQKNEFLEQAARRYRTYASGGNIHWNFTFLNNHLLYDKKEVFWLKLTLEQCRFECRKCFLIYSLFL